MSYRSAFHVPEHFSVAARFTNNRFSKPLSISLRNQVPCDRDAQDGSSYKANRSCETDFVIRTIFLRIDIWSNDTLQLRRSLSQESVIALHLERELLHS